MAEQNRRQLIGTIAGGVMTATLSAQRARAGSYAKVVLPPESATPLETAAAELATKTGAEIVRRSPSTAIEAGEIVLVLAEGIHAYPEALALLPSGGAAREWELVKRVSNGLVVAGSSPRNVCHAALAWVEDPDGETDRVSTFAFDERFTMWDNPLNQLYRGAKNFDRRQHMREVARLGHTGIEVNRYASAGGYWVNQRRFKDDSYTWYLSYAPALDAFVETSLTKGIYPAQALAANLADLRGAVKIAREYGLKPGFVCYEPRCVPEAVFDRYPGLRGSRVDHPGRSLEPRYSLDIASPRVLAHYREALARLMEEVPDLRYLVFWTEDSGSGIPFTKGLYAGPNGSYRARASTVGKIVADFSGALQEAGAKINPEFETIMKIGWEYFDDERREITGSLPAGVTVAHDVGGRVLSGGEAGAGVTKIKESRERGLDPYVEISVGFSGEPEPIIGVVRAPVLFKKFEHLRTLGAKRIFSHGGVASPPQCPYHLTQELFAELIRGVHPDPNTFYLKTATRWCDGNAQAAVSLVKAWQSGDEAIGKWPLFNWYHAGPGQTQARWLIRPIVPDITRLDSRERSAWERQLFPLPWDIARLNIAFEGGIRMYEDTQLEQAVREYDSGMLPGLERTVAILDEAIRDVGAKTVLVDQRNRYFAFLLRARTVRNLFEAQAAINRYLTRKGDRPAERERLAAAIRAEISNTEGWLEFFATTPVEVFRIAEGIETPFLYKTPAEDFRVKLEAMRAHTDDRPGPMLAELTVPLSEQNLLFYGK
ncbi:MAG: hypothetical protein IT170_13075 [Bryobacterales bacterium]|nr:hypothetical protein [Bryobacterales bacterium]